MVEQQQRHARFAVQRFCECALLDDVAVAVFVAEDRGIAGQIEVAIVDSILARLGAEGFGLQWDCVRCQCHGVDLMSWFVALTELRINCSAPDRR